MQNKEMKIAVAVFFFFIALASDTFAAETDMHAVMSYRLDDALGEFALYPGAAYRGGVAPKDMVNSLADLEQRMSKLPEGTSVMWTPYRMDIANKPMLFFEGQFDEFQSFCHSHGIHLTISPPYYQEYLLDKSSGEFAFYSGSVRRSSFPSGYIVHSLAELEQRVSKIPTHSRIFWNPYIKDPSSGHPVSASDVLFSKGQLCEFWNFCLTSGVELVLYPTYNPPAPMTTCESQGKPVH